MLNSSSKSAAAVQDGSCVSEFSLPAFGLKTLKFHVGANLSRVGVLRYAFPQDQIPGLIGADPRIRVNPNDIGHFVPRTKLYWPLRKRHFIVGGDWDLRLPPFALHRDYQIMRDLIEEPDREDLGTSLAFRRLKSMIDANCCITLRGERLDSDSKIIGYLRRYLDLRDSLLANGYRAEPDPDDCEIGVAVGRDGRLIHFSHGKHRLALAQLLGVTEIVAKIRVVHPRWYLSFQQLFGHGVAGTLTTGLVDAGQALNPVRWSDDR